MKQYSIRQQVAALTLIPLLLMAISIESYLMYDRFKHMDEVLLEKGELIAHQLAASSEYGVFSNNRMFLSDIAKGALLQPDVRGVVVLNSASEILANIGKLSTNLNGEAVSRILAENYHVRQLYSVSIEEMDKAIALQPPENRGKQVIWLYHAILPVQISFDNSKITAAIKPVGAVIVEISMLRNEQLKSRMLWVTLLATTLFLLLASYLIYLASRSITHPIQKLSEAVDEIGAGKLDTRVCLETRVRELSTLAHGLNETTENLQHERAGLQLRIDEATQALIEKKEEAERANHNKSHFLAAASHDLRQPLHALVLYVAELQRKLSGTDQQRLVEQIVQAIDVYSELLNALLDISKLDAGVIVPQIRTFSMDAMLQRISADYQIFAKDKNIRLVVRQCNYSVISDPLLLERILINLISNAIRYTYQNGSVMVACRRRGNFLRIEVRDNGIGISKHDQTNIFREFFQLKQTHLDNTNGLGLGLAIVERMVKLLGSCIELRSAPGKGAMFALEVPLALRSDSVVTAAPALLDQCPAPSGSPFSGRKLLVVEDDPAVLSGTANLLLSWNFLVSTAASIEQVEKLIHNGEKWDLIISDYQLENNTNGIEVIASARRHQKQAVPCILVTGDASQKVTLLASNNGYPLVYKPIKPAKLRSLIMHLLEEGVNQRSDIQ